MGTIKKKQTYKPKKENEFKLSSYLKKIKDVIRKSVYSVSWFGNVNEANGWGIIYPFDADGSYLTVDTTLFSADSTTLTADATVY
jgi:hypothetical protein